MTHHPLFLVWLGIQAASVLLILVAFVRGSKQWQIAALVTVLTGFILGAFVLAGGTR